MKPNLTLLTALLFVPLAALHGADVGDQPESVSPSDLVYERPAETPDAGQPIGNGRMGTMVWTSPAAVHLQINRVDVFAVNRDHQGQPGHRGSTTDYCGGIAGVVIHVGGQPLAPDEESFRQRLSLETAECTIEGQGLEVRCFISADSDVLVMEVDDRREAPQPMKMTVSMLRNPEVRTGAHIATSTFIDAPSRIVLTQRFRERDYHHASAVVVAVAGGGAAIEQTSATSRTLILPAVQGRRVILISSVAAWDPDRDIARTAGALADEAGARPVAELRAAHQAWWKEFWSRTFVKQEADGRYHLTGTHAHEDFWGVGDSIMDLAAIRGTVPLAIRAAEILEVDAELRDQWKEFLANLAPYPMGNDPRAKALTGGALADDVWAAGNLGEIDGQHNPEDVWLTPVFPFEDWTLETRDAATDAIVQKLIDLAPRHASVLRGAGLNTAIRPPIAVARAGRGRELPQVLERYYAAFAPLPNGMSLFEGPTAASVEHLGLLTMTLQESLLQSVSPRPGEPEVIGVFPAWPTEWDASFRLLARGGFLVSSEIQAGKVQFVEIESRLGEKCRLRNPWAGMCVIAEINGGGQKLAGEFLRFQTAAGRRYRCIPEE